MESGRFGICIYALVKAAGLRPYPIPLLSYCVPLAFPVLAEQHQLTTTGIPLSSAFAQSPIDAGQVGVWVGVGQAGSLLWVGVRAWVVG